MESHTGFFQETCVTREKGLEFRFRAKRFFRLLSILLTRKQNSMRIQVLKCGKRRLCISPYPSE
ncbi:hypothetical protein LEP1GSC163_1240 [Leptospira santarosai str. CBC379]|nr:hypothetical protein LEP1GSC163_1240 [Leptospira santarosai str. CBC379]